VSRYICKCAPGHSWVGRRTFKDTISRNFADELAKLELEWRDREPPTFHESLSERLYDKQGGVRTQDLLGHKDPRSTALYHDSRGTE
jgi:integrase